MKLLGLWISLLCVSALSVPAQVAVEITQTQDQFLPGETVPIAVRVINHSGQTLHLGEDEDWLTLSVEARNGVIVQPTGEVPVVGAFDLPSSKVAIKRLDLAPYFDLTRPDRYKVVATVRIKDWDRDVVSPSRGFDVIDGVSLWEEDFGVPRASGQPSGPPETRRYMLQQANYLRENLQLYLRVTDASGRPIRVARVGRALSFSRPEHVIDPISNLHVLYQDGARAFSYTVYNPDGDLLIRQTYDYGERRPRLVVDAQGMVSVGGGVRRVTESDVPRSKPLVTPEPLLPTDQPAPPTGQPAPATNQPAPPADTQG